MEVMTNTPALPAATAIVSLRGKLASATTASPARHDLKAVRRRAQS